MKNLKGLGLCLFVLLLSACALQKPVTGIAYRVTLTLPAGDPGNTLTEALAGLAVSQVDWLPHNTYGADRERVATFRLPDAKAVEQFRQQLAATGLPVAGLMVVQTD